MSNLDEFVKIRLSDAKQILTNTDPKFVKAVEAAVSLSGKLFVPQIPTTTALPKGWVELLKTCADVLWQEDQLQCSVELLEPNRYKSLDSETAGRLATYHLTSWWHHAYALEEKVGVLISLMCKVYDCDESLKGKYREKLSKDIRDPLAKIRTPLAHGAGGRGTIFRALVASGRLEEFVAANDSFHAAFTVMYKRNPSLLPKWHQRQIAKTKWLLDSLVDILHRLEQECVTKGPN